MCDLENLKNEEAMTRVGSQRHSKEKSTMVHGSMNVKCWNVILQRKKTFLHGEWQKRVIVTKTANQLE